MNQSLVLGGSQISFRWPVRDSNRVTDVRGRRVSASPLVVPPDSGAGGGTASKNLGQSAKRRFGIRGGIGL